MSNVLVLTYWSYRDALIQTYTLPYVRLIRKYSGGTVYLVTMEQEPLRMTETEKSAVRRKLAAEGIVPVFLDYKPFGGNAMLSWIGYLLRLYFFILFKRISVIHAWCTTAGGMAYYLSRLTGKKLVVDSFEPHAESMVENGSWQPGSRAFRILFSLEKKQARRADVLVGLSEAMKQYTAEKYGPTHARWFIKPALIDLAKLPVVTPEQEQQIRAALQLEGKTTMIYAGKTGGLYFEDELFRLFRCAGEVFGEKLAIVMLTPVPAEKIAALAARNRVPEGLLRVRFVPQEEVFAYLSTADFAVNPVRPVPSKRCCTSIKDGEYWSAGLPMIIPPNISDDSGYVAANHAGVIWDDFSEEGCRKAATEMKELLASADRETLRARCRALAVKYRNMELADGIYAAIYGAAGDR